ncbi:alpha/beta fold hydrolase [Methylophaga sp.]|uniref:alpha/beta fold hydrolase n=1 Tax=Methylophaga sp. TaxID=2024840 RepID=UPI003A90F751
MKLHYQESGEGTPLIIIHGLFGSADNWRSMAKYFSRFYRVISVDLRNHGRSPHSDEQNFTVMADDIHELCEDLQLEHLHMLGHSLGGKVAMMFAAMYPQLVSKLIVVDISPRQYFSAHTPLMDAMMALNLSQFTRRTEVDDALAESIPDKAVRQFLLMNLVSEQETFQWRINLPALKANYPELMAAISEDEMFTMPSLFIYGELSDYVTEQDRQQISKQFTETRFSCIEKAGHWVQAERPQQFKKVVEEFLQND